LLHANIDSSPWEACLRGGGATAFVVASPYMRKGLVWAGWMGIALLAGPVAAEEVGPPVRFFADLTPDEQSTTTVSPGSGRAEFSLDRQTLKLSWTIRYSKLTSAAIGAAIHGPQRLGANAVVQIDLGGGSRPPPVLQGAAVLTDAQLEYLLAGRMYVNIRSQRYPAGELRGQIQRVPPEAKPRS
jgi:hypothetical protein